MKRTHSEATRRAAVLIFCACVYPAWGAVRVLVAILAAEGVPWSTPQRRRAHSAAAPDPARRG